MKRNLLLLVVLLALLTPAALWAQGEGITLEGLAAQLTSLTRAVSSHTERIAAIETAIAPTTTATATPTPTATTKAQTEAEAEAQKEIVHLARLLALNDYEGTGGTTRPWGSFFRLSDDEQERQIAFYLPLLTAATQKCGVEYRKMFQIVNSSANLLELDGVAAKLETPVRAYWLEWFSTYEITEPCEITIVDETGRLLDEYSTSATPRPVSTLEPTAKFTVLFKNGYVWAFEANFLTEEGDLLLHINDRTYTNFLGRISLTDDEEMGALYGEGHGYDKWEITSDDVDTIYAVVRGERFNCKRYGLYAQKCTKAE